MKPPPEGYHPLPEDRVIRSGDLIRLGPYGPWVPVSATIGSTPADNPAYQFARKEKET